jgi:hypothetical protein
MQKDALTTVASNNPVMEAIRETWDGSDEHATALAHLIRASRELWASRGKETPS